MTEEQWLSSDDPARMLAGVVAQWGDSDRKLRLFACASARRRPAFRHRDPAWLEAVRVGEAVADGAAMPADRPTTVTGSELGPLEPSARDAAAALCSVTSEMSAPEAALLRDIAGNPFRPAALPEGPRCQAGCVVPHGSSGSTYATYDSGGPDSGWAACERCKGTGRQPCPWLTPTALSLARAAYDEREGCPSCEQTGECRRYNPRRRHWLKDGPCPRCGGSGHLGTLDPARLAILSDALEEAGATAKGCIHCGGGAYIRMSPPCGCATSEPLLHLRSPGPHVRGCWAVDLILGKE